MTETYAKGAGEAGAGSGVLARALSSFIKLTPGEIAALRALEQRPHSFDKGEVITSPIEPSAGPFVVLEGFALKFRQDMSGHRQASMLLIPGDIGNLGSAVLFATDDFVVAEGHCVASRFRIDEFYTLLSEHPRVGAALVWRAAVARSILAEHLVDVGRRSAYHRIGHRLLELLVRMKWAGITTNDTLAFEIHLATLADMVGLSPEHASRTMKTLRDDGFISVTDRIITIEDAVGLATACEFDPSYLHLSGVPSRLDQRFS